MNHKTGACRKSYNKTSLDSESYQDCGNGKNNSVRHCGIVVKWIWMSHHLYKITFRLSHSHTFNILLYQFKIQTVAKPQLKCWFNVHFLFKVLNKATECLLSLYVYHFYFLGLDSCWGFMSTLSTWGTYDSRFYTAYTSLHTCI